MKIEKTEKIRKLSVKSILEACSVKIKEMEEGLLFTVFGIVRGVEDVESSYGTTTKLRGEFKAVMGQRMFASTVAYLPSGVIDMIKGYTDEKNVEFAVKVLKVNKPDTKQGYIYDIQPIVEPTESDPMKNLASLVMDSLTDTTGTEKPKKK